MATAGLRILVAKGTIKNAAGAVRQSAASKKEARSSQWALDLHLRPMSRGLAGFYRLHDRRNGRSRCQSENPIAIATSSSVSKKRLRDAMGAHVSIRELCRTAGLNQRTLLRAMRAIHGKTPCHYLRALRLVEARQAFLCTATPASSVTEVALRLDFVSSGVSRSIIGRQFGESPSDTLRRTTAGGSAQPVISCPDNDAMETNLCRQEARGRTTSVNRCCVRWSYLCRFDDVFVVSELHRRGSDLHW